jgi:3-phosphoshikimate 1-carboxyvinyltransferase
MSSSNDRIAIAPCGPLSASIRPPGSKSITNRALICAALAKGKSTLTGALASEDTEVMIQSLRRLGIQVEIESGGDQLNVQGFGARWPNQKAELFIGNSGTSVRFLTAMLATGKGEYRLDGVPRMRQRPIGDLTEALRALGAEVSSENGDNCPPVIVKARGLSGGTVSVRGDVSSQFLSALLMAAPYAKSSLVIEVEGDLVSRPYVEMTLAVMKSFGVDAAMEGWARISVERKDYRPTIYAIEPDASAASYFWAAAALAGGEMKVLGLTQKALQGDVRFVEVLAEMGCEVFEHHDGIAVRGGELHGIDVDMNDISDTVQTLAVVALFAKGATRIRNVAHIRHKETDRIGDLARELKKLGAEVSEFEDGLEITPRALHPASIATYNDHRMAMSFAIAGLKQPGVVIENPGCTAKTYPNFFQDLARVCKSAINAT